MMEMEAEDRFKDKTSADGTPLFNKKDLEILMNKWRVKHPDGGSSE